MEKTVSPVIIKRLPRYYRVITHLDSIGQTKVSSTAIAQLMDFTASQVRQDFCSFGAYGQQGYGYDVQKLKAELENIMGLNKMHNMIIIGAGNIGRAIAGYKGFGEAFKVCAVFDIAPEGIDLGEVKVMNMSQLADYCAANKVDIAVIATPRTAAAQAAQQVVNAGVKNIWNFAPTELDLPGDVLVENISMSESLYVLSYYMNRQEG